MVYANFEIDKHFFCNCTVICIDRYFFFANCPNQTFLIRTNLEEHDRFIWSFDQFYWYELAVESDCKWIKVGF